ncbi:hypothetical protein KJ603_01080 [Patescibacteria group bacterium]|nr:hypothetical protein [Patescibacteria group bacterium]
MKIMVNDPEKINEIIKIAEKACPNCTMGITIIPLKTLSRIEELDIICAVMPTGSVSIDPS